MNFRKASIFQRDTEKPEVQNDSGGMLAVWGSPGSGKTVTAVKIAKALSAKKKNVILLLCDMSAPMLPCICHADALESKGSLASVLAAARISENLIKHNLVTFKHNSYLAALGLLELQNEYSTPPFAQKQVVELLDGLRQIAPYVIVDCGSYIANDILSAVALMEADNVLRLANCDPKSVSYFSSQLPLLEDAEWDVDKQYKVASNVKPYQAADHVGKALGDATFVLPYPYAWPDAGELTAGGAFSLAWRCLDAQFWGVAQRRKRIFLLADFAGPLAPQLLFDVFGETGNCGKEVT